MYDEVNKRLLFNSDGRFRILMISDFHAGSRRKGFEDGNPYSPKIKEAIEDTKAEIKAKKAARAKKKAAEKTVCECPLKNCD